MGQALFLFRIAAGKIWEANAALGKTEFSQVLKRSFLPHMPAGDNQLKDWRRRVGSAAWLRNLRDRHSFHDPTYQQWQEMVEASDGWSDDEIFLSAESGNVFYAGSDAMAPHWMFGQMHRQDPGSAVDPVIGELIELLRQFTKVVEDLLGAFVFERLLQGEVPERLGTVASPQFEQVGLPFWTSMPAKKRR